ncbi:hypothetical protein GF380_05175 [Candidatus Uhrbacteria bacterium]|nr:hypothetical protein [Candidatus Uhrbacteria bacterium]
MSQPKDHITRTRLFSWLRAQAPLCKGIRPASGEQPWITLTCTQCHNTHAILFVALRDQGPDVYGATRVRLVVVRVTRSRISTEEYSEPLVLRAERDTDEDWQRKLYESCLDLGVPSESLNRLGRKIQEDES